MPISIFSKYRLRVGGLKNREAREESKEYTKIFSGLITFSLNKSLNAIFDPLLFGLRYLRELRGFFVEPLS